MEICKLILERFPAGFVVLYAYKPIFIQKYLLLFCSMFGNAVGGSHYSKSDVTVISQHTVIRNTSKSPKLFFI